MAGKLITNLTAASGAELASTSLLAGMAADGEEARKFTIAQVSALAGAPTGTLLYTQAFGTTNLTTTKVPVSIEGYDEIQWTLTGVGTVTILGQVSTDGGATPIATGYLGGVIGSAVAIRATTSLHLCSANVEDAFGTLKFARMAGALTEHRAVEIDAAGSIYVDSQIQTVAAAHNALSIFTGSGTQAAGTFKLYGIQYRT